MGRRHGRAERSKDSGTLVGVRTAVRAARQPVASGEQEAGPTGLAGPSFDVTGVPVFDRERSPHGEAAGGAAHEREAEQLASAMPSRPVPPLPQPLHPLSSPTTEGLPSTGEPLPAAARSYFEPHFGVDFSHVRVHVNGDADRAARTQQARAFTVGRDVVFAAGEYAPESERGRRLLAHELAHVVQQGVSSCAAEVAGVHGAAARIQRQEQPLPPVDPEIADLPGVRYVDAFSDAYYEVGYRAEGGNLSTWLTVEYADGTVIDVNIDEFLETSQSPDEASAAMRQGYIGLGGRIFPRTLTPATAPRLWAARRAAIETMERYNLDIIATALPAVFFVISMAATATPAGRMPKAGARPGSAAARVRLRSRQGTGSGGQQTGGQQTGGQQTGGQQAAAGLQGAAAATTAATRQVAGLARNAPELGGFRAGISADEIVALNRQFGGMTPLTGHPSSAVAAAAREAGFWRKVAVIVREIAGRHLFNDANKRTATAVVNELRRRNGVVTGVEGATLRDVIHRVATGQLRTVDEIMVALRGF